MGKEITNKSAASNKVPIIGAPIRIDNCRRGEKPGADGYCIGDKAKPSFVYTADFLRNYWRRVAAEMRKEQQWREYEECMKRPLNEPELFCKKPLYIPEYAEPSNDVWPGPDGV